MLAHVTRNSVRQRLHKSAHCKWSRILQQEQEVPYRFLSSFANNGSTVQHLDTGENVHEESPPLHVQNTRLALSPKPSLLRTTCTNQNDLFIPSSYLGSVRYMGRKDGNKAFFKPRKMPRKKQKARTRKMKLQHYEKEGKHSAPGTKMRARREQADLELDMLLDRAKGVTNRYLPEADDIHADLEYNEADAMLDDLVGNTGHLTSTPTPKPVRLDRYHSKNYHRVKRKMDSYYKQKRIAQETETDMIGVSLPTDNELSQLIRSYRDKYGSRRYPIGIAKVLQLLLVDLRIPSSLFREKAYTSLMTCAAHPKEAIRIMQLMDDHSQPKTSYVYSILVDLYAKKGDFRNARKTIDDMSLENIQPTLPAYTSLLAACFKVVNRGNAPHKLKAEAGTIGWEGWKEMRIIGLDADAMAYGSIIRLCAARGQAEKCLSLIDEMDQFQVLPTTLIFTSALRAISKAHENALRFEGGYSPKNKRREKLCSYFGKLTREVLIKAENAEVEHDNGFVSALMLCAAAAGDSATAKAIYLASEVRKMTYLRTIGSDQHLLGLTSDQDVSSHHHPQLHAGSNTKISSLEVQKLQQQKSHERDHGKDTRTQSALLLAYSNSMRHRGLGNVWQGHENKGYLCEVSLDSIKKHQEPKMHDNSIPGMTSMEVGLGSMTYEAEDPDRMSKKLRRKKFEGIYQDPNIGNTLDELDEDIFRMYDGVPNDLDGIDPDGYNFHTEMVNNSKEKGLLAELVSAQSSSTDSSPDVANGNEIDSLNNFEEHQSVEYDPSEGKASISSLNQHTQNEVIEDNEYFTDNTSAQSGQRSLKTQPTNQEYLEEYHDNVTELLSGDFEEFYKQMQQEIEESGEVDPPSEAEARELYEFMKMESDAAAMALEENDEEQMENVAKGYQAIKQSLDEIGEDGLKEGGGNQSAESFASELLDMSHEFTSQSTANPQGKNLIEKIRDSNFEPELQEDFFLQDDLVGTAKMLKTKTQAAPVESKILNGDMTMLEKELVESEVAEVVSSHRHTMQDSGDLFTDDSLSFHDDGEPKDELDLFLEGLPSSRIKTIRKTFSATLGDPSILRLVPILRENLPEKITKKWIRETNVRHAKYVLSQMEEEGSVDIHVVNGMLQVQTSAANIDDALRFYDTAKKKYGVTPNQYSDRLIIDMLVKCREIEKALQFKDKVESEGRKLDILSYGLLMEYYANREQLDPAISLLKETLSVHKYPPGEKSLSRIRIICRQRDIEKEVGLVEMIGEDPVRWFKHGEQKLKREYSKKGNRFVNEGRNIFTRI